MSYCMELNVATKVRVTNEREVQAEEMSRVAREDNIRNAYIKGSLKVSVEGLAGMEVNEEMTADRVEWKSKICSADPT